LQERGLFDPDAPDAQGRRVLLDYLLSLGATIDDLVEYRDELPVAASMIALRPTGARLTLRELARRTGLDDDTVQHLWRAYGLPHAGADDPVAYEQTIELFDLFKVGIEMLGRDAGMQMARLIGETAARLADALISSFMVEVGGPAWRRDPSLLALAEENARAAELVAPLMHVFEVLLRHHLEVARRPIADVFEESGFESRQLAIGFVDISGSTALAARVSFDELGRVLGAFESRCTEIVAARGGRLVKLIGDEAMFAVATVDTACAIGCDLVDTTADADADDGVPPVRVGIAAGDVLVRYGDCFGPVVNLAARLVAQAPPCTVVAPATLTKPIEAAGLAVTRVGAWTLRGFEDDVEVVRVTRS
jgi:adenylate cyclase